MSQEIVIASFVFSLKDPYHDSGVCGYLHGLSGDAECGEGAGCMAGAGLGFRCVLFSANQNENQNIYLNKNNRALSLCLFIWGITSLSTLYRSYHDG